MKILGHIRSIGRVGGASISMQQLLTGLADMGHEVRLLGDVPGDRESVRGVQCITTDNDSVRQNIYRWADVIITQLTATPTAQRIARMTRRHLCHYIHDADQIRLYHIDDAQLMIFNSRHLQEASGWAGPSLVVNPPVFPEMYQAQGDHDSIVMVNLLPAKGAPLFYHLAKILPHRHFIGVRGRGASYILSPLPANVEIIGAVDPDKMAQEIYSRARVVLMPSEVETWGRIGIEAAASGIPTIASAGVPGLEESLGISGLFILPDMEMTWAGQIERLYNDAEYYDARGLLAKARSRELDPRPQIGALVKELEATCTRKPEPVVLRQSTANRVDMFSTQRHFIDHLAGIYQALPDHVRGRFIVEDGPLVAHLARLGITATCYANDSALSDILSKSVGPVVVAGTSRDGLLTQKRRPLVLLNHGAGQSFVDSAHPSYAGGKSRGRVSLFLEPGDHPAARDAATYPRARVAVVGCPKMDEWHRRPPKERSDPPVVAVSFHWDCQVVPETRTALDHYEPVLGELSRMEGVKILGHGHPAIWSRLKPLWDFYGVETVTHFEEVLERADVYCIDHMSTLYEFASLDRPVVVLNAPWYRRDVEHGLRWWEAANVGVQVDEPEDLIPAIYEALEDSAERQYERYQAVQKVYKYTDGRATERAVCAILDLMGGFTDE